MERDTSIRELDFAPWDGNVRPGVFVTDDVKAVRDDWLRDGIVPRANVRGFNEFNSITRTTAEGDCTVKALPQYFTEIQEFAQRIGLTYAAQGAGMVTLAAVEHPMAPKREPVTEAENAAIILRQKHLCATCGTLLDRNAAELEHGPAPELDHVPRIHESRHQSLEYK